ncbi:MAG: radical SAM protein [Thermoplasmata archaeon]|nr:radical SAM protein [Thermoplasmata archaeon]
MTSLGTEQKAKLLEIGEIFIPREIDMPCFASRSTAGPDAGSSAHAFEFNGTRVKIAVTKNPDARLKLARSNGDFQISLDGEVFIAHARVLHLIAHAPNQAFMNLASECIMGCAFCAMSYPTSKPVVSMEPERLMKIISISSRHPSFEAVAITSGIPVSVKETTVAMIEMVKQIRVQYPEIPIGVEPYIEDLEDIQRFKDAGANEMKINIETWPPALFARICPNRDRDMILAALEESVKIFGKGKVMSNFIIGLGESEEELYEGLAALSKMGVVPNVRGIRLGPLNREKLEKALGKAPAKVPAEKLIEIGKKHREILEMNDLDTATFSTMCFTCKCCDLIPMVDL